MSSQAPDMGDRHVYLTLDGMRGVAAIAVVLMHLKPFGSQAWDVPSGYLAVDLFFVLSGFVIAKAYDPRFAAGTGTITFMVARLIRLWPLIVLGIGLAALNLLLPSTDAASPHSSDVLRATIMNMMMLPDPWTSTGYVFHLNSPQWSLFWELAINFLFALYMVGCRRKFDLPLILLGAALLLVSAKIFHGLNIGWSRGDWWGGLARVFYSFSIGVVIFRTRPQWKKYFPEIAPVVLCIATASLFLISLTGWQRTLFDVVFALFLSPLLVMAASCTEPRGRLHDTFKWLGFVSYPLYAVHYPLIHFFDRWVPPSASFRPIAAIPFLLFCLAASYFLGRYFDAPVRAQLGRAVSWIDAGRRAVWARI